MGTQGGHWAKVLDFQLARLTPGCPQGPPTYPTSKLIQILETAPDPSQ